jgi:hypothetical protein
MAAALAAPAGVYARPRPRFEPTDLEWEETGVFEADVELGAIRSPGPWRFVLADFELDFGILPNVEIGLDGAYAIEGPTLGAFSFDHAVVYPLWLSTKIGLYDDHDPETGRARAVGVQIGPKLPIAAGSRGLGGEALLVFGGSRRGLTVAVNLGAFIEPAQPGLGRQAGAEAGLDLELQLDDQDRFQLTGEIGGAYFISNDPTQLHATAGLTWSATPMLDFSVVGIVGILPGDDHYGLLFGVEPKLRVFEAAARDKKGP